MENTSMTTIYHTFLQNSSKSDRQVVERGKIDTSKAQKHDRSLSYIGTNTSIKSGGIN
jgi:hypothetical protein